MNCYLLILEKPATGINDSFDVIIADVPCSGSGTWSRTPEQLIFFQQKGYRKICISSKENYRKCHSSFKAEWSFIIYYMFCF